MATTITELTSALQYQGARPYLYEFRIGSWPEAVVPGLVVPEDNVIRALTKGASIPTSQISTIEIPYKGRKIKYPGSRTFDDLTVTLFNDNDHVVRNAFESWSAAMAQHVSVFGNSVSLEDIAHDVFVDLYDLNENLVRSYQFIDAFPTSVSEIGLDFDNADSIMEFTVTFAYQYWRISGNAAPGVAAPALLTAQA